MLDDLSLSEWLKTAGATGFLGLAAALCAKITFRKIAEERTSEQLADAVSHMVAMLRAEVARLSAANEQCFVKIASLQEELSALKARCQECAFFKKGVLS